MSAKRFQPPALACACALACWLAAPCPGNEAAGSLPWLAIVGSAAPCPGKAAGSRFQPPALAPWQGRRLPALAPDSSRLPWLPMLDDEAAGSLPWLDDEAAGSLAPDPDLPAQSELTAHTDPPTEPAQSLQSLQSVVGVVRARHLGFLTGALAP